MAQRRNDERTGAASDKSHTETSGFEASANKTTGGEEVSAISSEFAKDTRHYMEGALLDQAVPREGDPGYGDWHSNRHHRLKHQVLEAVLRVPEEDLPRVRSRGAVMVNVSDVVHDRIGSETVRIELSDTESSDDLIERDGRQSLMGMWYVLADMISAVEGQEALDEDFDPYIDDRGDQFDSLPPDEIRAFLLEFLVGQDLVGTVRNEMRFRSYR
mgnify:CR=1 FL=1